MTTLDVGAGRAQEPLSTQPYDRWVSPLGDCICEFHRASSGWILRFPGEADFWIEAGLGTVTAWPAIDADPAVTQKLFDNSILPLLGNHAGGLFLHGSAACIDDAAIAFLGHSRSGKTTLAGFFAKSGHPFMTEDVVDLYRESSDYTLRPKPSSLRLFKDSAEHLLGRNLDYAASSGKQSIAAADELPFMDEHRPLTAICVLGEDHNAPLSLRALSPAAALPRLLPHAFILDVEDKPRLKSHFERLGQLAQHVPVYALDYPREYSALPKVRSAILQGIQGTGNDETQ